MSRTQARGIAALCLVLALLAGVASGLGVFDRGNGTYASATSIRGEHYRYATTGIYAYNAERLVAEGVGWDVVTLFLAVPALLLLVVPVARGSLRARLAAAGILGYFFYQFVMYALMNAFGVMFVPYVLLYSGSLAGVIWIATTCPAEELTRRLAARFPRRSLAAFDFAMAALLVLMWGQRIAAGLRGDFNGAGRLFGLSTMQVQALDLGLIVPFAVLTGILVLQRKPLGYLLGAVFTVKGFTMATGIAAMLVSAWMVEGRLEVVPFAIFVAAALVALGLGVQMFHDRGGPAEAVGIAGARVRALDGLASK